MAGEGKPGYCKLCDSQWAEAINKLIEQDKNEAEVKRAIQVIDPKMTWNRQTFYAHKNHITSPLITHVKKAEANPVVAPKTTRGVLEAIRDLGMQRAIEHPEEVTVDHALRAASELARGEKKTDDIRIVLAKIIATGPAPEVITGEFTEIPQLETDEEVPLGIDA